MLNFNRNLSRLFFLEVAKIAVHQRKLIFNLFPRMLQSFFLFLLLPQSCESLSNSEERHPISSSLTNPFSRKWVRPFCLRRKEPTLKVNGRTLNQCNLIKKTSSLESHCQTLHKYIQKLFFFFVKNNLKFTYFSPSHFQPWLAMPFKCLQI